MDSRSVAREAGKRRENDLYFDIIMVREKRTHSLTGAYFLFISPSSTLCTWQLSPKYIEKKHYQLRGINEGKKRCAMLHYKGLTIPTFSSFSIPFLIVTLLEDII